MEEGTKAKNVPHMLISKVIYIYLLTALSQVRLQNFVMSAFLDYKKLVVSPLSITKMCRVHIFVLQNFVVSAFSVLAPLFICSVRIFLSQKF